MSAEIVLRKYPEIRVETTPQVAVCETTPDESTERSVARLGFRYFRELGAMCIFATVPFWETNRRVGSSPN